jgi:hypothetical protein
MRCNASFLVPDRKIDHVLLDGLSVKLEQRISVCSYEVKELL